MKNMTLIFLFLSGIAEASNLNSSLELSYIYGSFVLVVLLVAGTDLLLKYYYKKYKKHEEQSSVERFEE